MVDSLSDPQDSLRMQRLFTYVGNLSKIKSIQAFEDFFADDDDIHNPIFTDPESDNRLEDFPHIKQIKGNLYLFAYAFAKSRRFAKSKTVVFLKILKKLVDFDAANDLHSMRQSYNLFQDLLLLHSCERPPWTCKIFTTEDVEAITNYVLSNYFLHHGVYKHLLAKNLHLDMNQYQAGNTDKPGKLTQLGDMSMLEGEEADEILRQSPFGVECEANPTDSNSLESSEHKGTGEGDEQNPSMDKAEEQSGDKGAECGNIEDVFPQAQSLIDGLAPEEQAAVLQAARELVASKRREEILSSIGIVSDDTDA